MSHPYQNMFNVLSILNDVKENRDTANVHQEALEFTFEYPAPLLTPFRLRLPCCCSMEPASKFALGKFVSNAPPRHTKVSGSGDVIQDRGEIYKHINKRNEKGQYQHNSS